MTQRDSSYFLTRLLADRPKGGLQLEALRLSFVFVPLVAFIFIQCVQSEFVNLEVWSAVFAVLSLSFLVHIVYLIQHRPKAEDLTLNIGVFFVDAFVLSALMFYTGISAAVFVLLMLLNILLCGLYFNKAYWLALWTSALYSVVLVLSPEGSSYSLYFSAVLNNMAFFVIASLATHLNKQFSGAAQQVVQQQNTIQHLQRRRVQQEKLAAVGQLASGVAHEIRNPLASVSGSVQMLTQSVVLNDEAKKLTQIITREVDRLNNLLNDLLDFVRPDKLNRGLVNLNQLLHEAVQVLSLNKQLCAGVEFKINSPHKLTLTGDNEQLKQVFLNIFINAVQAIKETPSGRGCVQIDTWSRSGYVYISVQDEGVGMKSTDKIFEVFHTTKNQGTGLGLSIVQKIVHSHGGEVEAQSQLGQGTQMLVSLPLKARSTRS